MTIIRSGLNQSIVMAMLGVLSLLAGCSTSSIRPRGAPGDRYVAVGSSFAAGPGITVQAGGSPERCARSEDNYARLTARRLQLKLVDVTCSGATTAHVLGAWNELPPQIDVLNDDTSLVTITIGGNDVGYISGLRAVSCLTRERAGQGQAETKCHSMPPLRPDAWQKLERDMRNIVVEIRKRAPKARIIFVDYLTVLPTRGACAATPLPAGQADQSRATAARLAALTAKVAQESDSEILQASALSRGHSACDRDPWVTGYPSPGMKIFAPYHPTARGMAAVADALVKKIRAGATSPD